jgi:hypothetical protein
MEWSMQLDKLMARPESEPELRQKLKEPWLALRLRLRPKARAGWGKSQSAVRSGLAKNLLHLFTPKKH